MTTRRRTLEQVLLPPGVPAGDMAAAALLAPEALGRLDQLVSVALTHNSPLILLERLRRAGWSLPELSIAETTWRASSTSKTVAQNLRQSAASRFDLDELYRALQEHVAWQRNVLADVARQEPRCVVLFGQAIAARYPSYRERFSHDVDLLCPDAEAMGTVAAHLQSALGYHRDEGRCADAEGGLAKISLSKEHAKGNRLHADIYAVGILSGSGQVPPFVVPTLFERADRSEVGGVGLLLPSAEDLLLLTAQKAQHLGRYTMRLVSDTVIVLNSGEYIDWAYVRRWGVRQGIAGALHWLIAEASRRTGKPSWVDEACIPSPLPERLLVRALDQGSAVPEEARDRLRRVHRKLWWLRRGRD